MGKGKGKRKGERTNGKEKGKGKGMGKGRWKEDSLSNVGRTDTNVILYSIQYYALHWTDNQSYMNEVQPVSVIYLPSN